MNCLFRLMKLFFTTSVLSNFSVISLIFIIDKTKFICSVILHFCTELIADIFPFDTL